MATTDYGTNLTQQYPVRTGFWTNWSRGPVIGATLTLSRRDADILIAFTSTFVATVAVRTWTIARFSLHRLYSTSNARGALHHQHQAVLRNASAPEDGLQMILQLLCFSKNGRQSRLRARLVATAVVGVLLVVAFTVAGGFSSRILGTRDGEVLIRTDGCGYLNGDTNNNDVYFRYLSYQADKANDAMNYVQQCYNQQTGSLDCGSFVRERIGAQVDATAECPFDETMCRSTDGNLRLDSGFVDSHVHFGMNAPEDKRIQWRRVLECAPLVTSGFTSQVSEGYANYTVYHYGTSQTPAGTKDYVYRSESLEAQYKNSLSGDGVKNTNHQLNAYGATTINGVVSDYGSDFTPIKSLQRADGDLVLVFLSGNGVLYFEPTEDEWYRISPEAVNYTSVDSGTIFTQQVYLPSESSSPLACVDSHQFCTTPDGGDKECTPLLSIRDALAAGALLSGTTFDEVADRSGEMTERRAQYQYFTDHFFNFQFGVIGVVAELSSRALLSSQTLMLGVQGSLAPDQWQLEVANWWNISMALLQTGFLDSAYGPKDPAVLGAVVYYEDDEYEPLCRNQKFRTTVYASFSVFALAAVYLTGFLLILASYLLAPISRFLRRKANIGIHADLEWSTTATLQLQRLAHEGIGQGTWSRGTRAVPVTRQGEMLGQLDISDSKHPVLLGNVMMTPSSSIA